MAIGIYLSLTICRCLADQYYRLRTSLIRIEIGKLSIAFRSWPSSEELGGFLNRQPGSLELADDGIEQERELFSLTL